MNRYDFFPKLINENNYKIGIEIGVFWGEFSEHLLKNTNIITLYGLDIYRNVGEIERITKQYSGRFVFIDGRSPEYSKKFEDNFFDFIYIDAQHTYEAVKTDLESWYPKLKKNGLLFGDDYLLAHDHTESKFGVVEAVNEFCENKNIEFFVTGLESTKIEDKIQFAKDKWITFPDELYNPQWWFIKNE